MESTADTMWNTDLSRDMHPVFNPHVPPGKLDKLAKGQKGAGEKAKAAKSKGKGASNKTTAPHAGFKLGLPTMASNKKVKTARSNGKKAFSSFLKQQRVHKRSVLHI